MCVWDRERKTRSLIAVCVCQWKHLVWLVTQQLCKMNTTQFVPPLALYYAIIPFSNEQDWKQWSPLCFSALSSALLFLSSLCSFLLPSFFLVVLSSLTHSLIHNLSHLLKLLICLSRNPGRLYWLCKQCVLMSLITDGSWQDYFFYSNLLFSLFWYCCSTSCECLRLKICGVLSNMIYSCQSWTLGPLMRQMHKFKLSKSW